MNFKMFKINKIKYHKNQQKMDTNWKKIQEGKKPTK